MFRTYCLESGKDWDEGIDLLLFSVRDIVQKSLGFTPFQLIYGHEVRGPLKVLKESWLGEENTIPVATYVRNFHKLQSAIKLAHSHLGEAQERMKTHFDQFRKVELCSFQEGDQVLALLPIPKHPLQSKYYGPYRVSKKIGDVNYIIETPERRKKKCHVHVNLLKKFLARKQNDKGDTENVTSKLKGDCERV